ncbi:MAG: M23 family metallopeptidase [Luteibaculaceae bacterium]
MKLKEVFIFRNFRSKYRLVIQDENNFAEKFSLRLSRANVLALFSGIFLSISLAVLLIIAFTPLKEFIPGYPDSELKETAFNSQRVLDSLERSMAINQQYVDRLRRILLDELEEDSLLLGSQEPINLSSITFTRSTDDSLLRQRLETEIEYSLSMANVKDRRRNIDLATTVFFPPIRGTVTDPFNLSKEHYGIDIVSKKDAPIKATLGGIVVLASWTSDAGNVIQIQHENDLISVYKHNAVLLKRQGDKVKAGETIAIIGNTGEYTSGPHLHFELWHKGKPVDPAFYMSFE